jgi:ataxia telangiectasia mutated family protein
MGPSGTEGTFSRAAEATISVLRDNADALLTILSAVVSDPAYKFCLTPREAQRRQRDNDDVVEVELRGEGTTELENEAGVRALAKIHENEAAVRALAKIHEKLQGHEDGTSGERQSIEGQVQLLINSARNPENLSLLYHGWSAWL